MALVGGFTDLEPVDGAPSAQPDWLGRFDSVNQSDLSPLPGLLSIARIQGCAALPESSGVLCVCGSTESALRFRNLLADALDAEVCCLESEGRGHARQLGRLLDQRQPAVLLVDVDLCTSLDPASLRHVRVTHPAIRLLLAWPSPAPRWVPLIIQLQARGGVEWSASQAHVEHAIDAVLAGELWLPRQVTQWVISALLGQATPGQASVDDDGESKSSLTPRELEVLGMMREGLSNKQMAAHMDISINTVKKHVSHAFEKRGIFARRQLT